MTLSNRAVSRLQQLVSHAPVPPARYTLHEVIGQGGMGTVYRAHDVQLGRDVAFKVLDERGALSADASDRLQREATILAQLEHPGIVPVHDVGELENGSAFYVMRLVRGERLDEHVSRGVGRGDVLRLMLRLCETVAFANAQGVVHRDLKPGNIMIGPFGEVLVLDWGVAKLLSNALSSAPQGIAPTGTRVSENIATTLDGMIVGTPGYMSPEQQAGASAHVNQTADVFALGVIMRELLAHVNEPTNRVLHAIMNCATASEPSARYASATAMADDVRRWIDGQSVAAYRESAVEKLLRLYRQHQ
ncbi:MAG: serine/threonine-protein kinase, partial [Gemmatimonadaceae bacterium]